MFMIHNPHKDVIIINFIIDAFWNPYAISPKTLTPPNIKKAIAVKIPTRLINCEDIFLYILSWTGLIIFLNLLLNSSSDCFKDLY